MGGIPPLLKRTRRSSFRSIQGKVQRCQISGVLFLKKGAFFYLRLKAVYCVWKRPCNLTLYIGLKSFTMSQRFSAQLNRFR